MNKFAREGAIQNLSHYSITRTRNTNNRYRVTPTIQLLHDPDGDGEIMSKSKTVQILKNASTKNIVPYLKMHHRRVQIMD